MIYTAQICQGCKYTFVVPQVYDLY